MKFNKPTKVLDFRFQQLTEKNKDNAKAFINKLKNEYNFELLADESSLSVISDEIEVLNEVYDRCFVYFMKKGLKFEAMFKCSWDINTEEEDSIGYLNRIFDNPTDEEHYIFLEMTFVYRKGDTFFLVHIEISGENQITLELTDSIEKGNSITRKYDDAVIAMHKIMKY